MADQVKRGLVIDDLLAGKREAILRLAEQHRAYNVRVFGSLARGEGGPDSDVDFLVAFRPGYTLWDHIGLMQSLEDPLGCKVDVVAEDALKPGLRERALAEAVRLAVQDGQFTDSE